MKPEHRSQLTGFPGLGSLLKVVDQLRNRPIHVVEMTDQRGRSLGNHGDWVMHRVFDQILEDLGVTRVAATAHAEFIVVPPSGALLDVYQAPRILANRIAALPDVPAFVFPSSARFLTSDPAELFAGRRAPTVWISRERYSHDHLAKDWGRSLSTAGVELVLDHDVVCSGHEIVPRLFPVPESETALLVARLGAEAGNLADKAPKPAATRRAAVALYDRLPSASLRRAIRRRVTRTSQSMANAEMLGSLGSASAPFVEGGSQGPQLDISDPSLWSLNDYRRAVASAHSVATNRLHVALPAAILGKDVVLVDSGYHKLRGVYEQSLSNVPNITFLTEK